MYKFIYEDISDDEEMLCFDEMNCIYNTISKNHMDKEVICIENGNDEVDLRNVDDDALSSDKKMNSFNESNISKCFTTKCENNGDDEIDIISSDRKRKFNEDSEDDDCKDDDSEDDYSEDDDSEDDDSKDDDSEDDDSKDDDSEDDDNESDGPIFYYEEQGACDRYYEKRFNSMQRSYKKYGVKRLRWW
ncbi:PREDICTED: transcription initiation factor TFIID subunit 11-like [Nicrophorus vespilloides]|uniref:Transcription initiation factor TFIID subunit 11-like n=1 Tax=Nicrophorus vespilloides TaxID=110193 RepID=A0ABM1MQ38_NICVS|nr:PREDICTED: transcription initiation factor TFIID subunit 11-like [Nicrophorus vespilloides]